MPRAPRKTPALPHRCGFAAIVGRPNVGKSTLLNALVGTKVSIVTPKPQTTRHRILGILSRPQAQIVFVDTPGIHSQARRVMNQYMNRSALSSLDADVLLLVVEALQWTEDDDRVLERVRESNRPLIAIVNKVDRVREKQRLLPYLKELARRAEFKAVVPLSAGKRDKNLAKLPKLIEELLPEGPALFPTDKVTDRSERFLAAEIIREKLTWRLREELPYGLNVEIERFEEQGARVGIGAIVWVERPGQKAIVIGAGGERLKEIGRLARLEINELLKKSVHLELWVKVKENWSDSEQALKSFGYEST